MTPCPSREHLALLLAERLGGAEADAVADHVQTCPGCQGALDELSGTAAARPSQTPTLGAAPPRPEPDTGFLRRLAENVPTFSLRPAPGADRPPPAGWPRVEGYEIEGELGRGGMGVVYKARQVSLNRVVALKVLLAGAHAGRHDLARFRGEAEAAARLQHPNIVQVFEVGEADGRPYLALEYVAGGSLAQRLRGAPLPAREAAALVEVLARAVHAAHQRGVVHRDLKPGNVLLAPDGTPKVTDFGLAKRLDAPTAHTQTGALVGTPDYMAPEQAEGKREVGPAADTYALGAVLYHLLTGRPPFVAETPLDTVLRVRLEDPVPPTVLQPRVPRDLETVCLKCLQKSPERRYAAAADLADDLRRFLAGVPVRARPVSRGERALRWAKRQPAAAALLGVSLAAAAILAAATALLAASNQRERRHREAAQTAERQAREQGAEVSRQRDRAVAQRHLAHAALEEIWRQLGWR
ncbi:MAG TPA: serine/threonine-protein kinase, partial [Gemmataceae bacterium]|nr:serine/threonine-protein kinase [Gemmataceae bacterium]